MSAWLIGQSSAVSSGVVIGLGLLFVLVTLIALVAKFTVVGNPSELLVISGRRGGPDVGYRTLIGGRTVVVPILEKVSLLSLRNLQVALEVKAQSGGGKMIPINVNGVANVKISSDPEIRGNAIERFLGAPQQELERVARETLEGGLRAVIGKMTPEEIVEDRDKFVATVMNEVTDDFRKLGMVIDSVNIQNVHDDDQYLVSIARKASADVRASARQFEAQRKADADIKEAESEALARKAKAERDAEARSAEAAGHQKAESARLIAEKAIAEANNALRIRQAELAREAAVKEAEAQIAAAQAEEARLDATQVKQANADRDTAKAKAEGAAATVLEEGKARAAAIEYIGSAIQKNPDALRVMLVEMLPGVVREMTTTIAGVELGNVTVIDSGNGHAISGAALSRARMLSESFTTLETILGIDLGTLASSIAERIGTPRTGTPPDSDGVVTVKGPH